MLKEYRTLLPYFKKYWFKYIFGICFLIITDAGQLYLPQFIRKAVNTLSNGTFDSAQIGTLMIQMVAVALVISIGRFFWRFFLHGASRRIETELREKIFYHLLTLSSSFFGKNKTGDLMARMTNDMKAVRMASGMAFVAFTDGLFMALAILAILLVNYPKLTLIVIIPLPFINLMVMTTGRLLGKRFKRVQDSYSSISERVQEILSGIRVIKIFRKEDHFLSLFDEDNTDYWEANMALTKIWGGIFPIVMFLSGTTVSLLLYFGGRQVIQGTLEPGDFVAVLAYLGMLTWPMMGAGFTINLIQRGGASLMRINAVLDEEPDILNVPEPADVPRLERLSIQDLDYSFNNSKSSPVIKDFSLSINAGETLGILGRTGSGKTTLIRLLPRLLESEQGSVLYNDIPIHDLRLSQLRAAISMVPQETILFSRTIRENILFSKEDAPQEELDRVIHISTLERDLKNFPNGLETMVGERGITLSGGQKQRIALARALLAEPQVLVLDDALSAVDTKTEEFILNELMKIRQGKTNIIISHRVSTLQVSDKILVLDKGRIGQYGSHEELLKEEGLYKKIYTLQSLEHEETAP